MDDVYRLNPRAIWERLRREPLHFWLFAAYVFFEYVRPHSIYPVIDVLPWGRILILGALFAVLLDSRSSKSLAGPLTFPVLGCFAVVFLSFVFAFSPAQAMSGYDVLVNWILVYLLFLWVVNTRFRLFIVFLILLLASFKMAQHGFRSGLSRGFAFQRWGVAGASGFFRNAADIGVQMTIFVAWSVAFYYGLRDRWQYRAQRWLFLFFPVAGLATALTTGQRNTTLAFVAMGLAAVVLSRERVRNLVLVGIVGAAALAVAPDEFKDRFDNAQESGTAQARLHYWEMGLKFYRDNPVIGVGHNNFRLYFAMNHPEEILGIRSGVQVAHSVPVTVAAETGTLGLFFYYLVVVMVFLTNVRSARIFRGTDPPFWRYLALSLNYGLLGFLVTGIFLSTAYYPFLWYQAGLTASLYGIAQRERSRQAQVPRPAVARTRPGVSGGLAHSRPGRRAASGGP
jgi:putative inorganic carbon (hco3(-)) transporter